MLAECNASRNVVTLPARTKNANRSGSAMRNLFVMSLSVLPKRDPFSSTMEWNASIAWWDCNLRLSKAAVSEISRGSFSTSHYSLLKSCFTDVYVIFIGSALNHVRAGPCKWRWKAAIARALSILGSMPDSMRYDSNSLRNLDAFSCI